MFWNYAVQMLFGSSLITAQSVWPHGQKPVSSEEIKTYECAMSVASMLYPADQSGPIFAIDELIFTSVEASDNSRMLIVSAGAGTFSIPLARAGVNRLRFSLPTKSSVKPKEFYLGYMHDTLSRSRYFDFSSQRPPMGKDKYDYAPEVPRRAENILPNLEFKIHQTAEALLAQLTEGRMARNQVQLQGSETCAHLGRKSPALGQMLKRNLEVVQMIVTGPLNKPAKTIAALATVTGVSSSRAPASVASAQKP